MTYKERRNL